MLSKSLCQPLRLCGLLSYLSQGSSHKKSINSFSCTFSSTNCSNMHGGYANKPLHARSTPTCPDKSLHVFLSSPYKPTNGSRISRNPRRFNHGLLKKIRRVFHVIGPSRKKDLCSMFSGATTVIPPKHSLYYKPWSTEVRSATASKPHTARAQTGMRTAGGEVKASFMSFGFLLGDSWTDES